MQIWCVIFSDKRETSSNVIGCVLKMKILQTKLPRVNIFFFQPSLSTADKGLVLLRRNQTFYQVFRFHVDNN